MKKLLFSLILSIIPLISFAQNSDSLTLGKSNREFFIKGDQKFKFSEYKKVFTNTEALNYMKKANTNSTVSQIFAAIGGGLIGYGLVKKLHGIKPCITMASLLKRKKQVVGDL